MISSMWSFHTLPSYISLSLTFHATSSLNIFSPILINFKIEVDILSIPLTVVQSLLIALPNTFFACFFMLLYRVLFFSVADLKISFYAAFFHAITPFTYSLQHHVFPRIFLLSTNFMTCLQNWFLGFPLILCISIDQLSSFKYIYSRFTHTNQCIGYIFTRILRQAWNVHIFHCLFRTFQVI